MVKTVKRTLTFSTDLDEAIASLAVENNVSYSRYVESRLLMNDTIRNMVLKLEKVPEMPVVDVESIKENNEAVRAN